MRQRHASATPPIRLHRGDEHTRSARLCTAHVCAQRTSGDECTYVASPPGPVRQQWQNAIAHGTPPSLLCPSPLGPAVAEHTRMRQCGPPPAPLALTAPRGSGSSLNAAAAARRPVTRDTHMSDHALIIDDPHVSDESLMTHRQREVLPARGTWEWYGPAPLRPSSQLSPWLHRHGATRCPQGSAMCLGR